jgi:hypothetical protein
MTGMVSHLWETGSPVHKTDVDLPSKVRLWAVADPDGTYSMNHLNEKHEHECAYVSNGPVQYEFLKERDRNNAYVVPIVSSGKLKVSVRGCERVEIEVLIFRPGSQPCGDMIFDPRPHDLAKEHRIAADVKANADAQAPEPAPPELVHSGEARPAPPSAPKTKAKAKGKQSKVSKKTTGSVVLDAPTINPVPLHHRDSVSKLNSARAPDVVAVGRVFQNARHGRFAARVDINTRLSPTFTFWLEVISTPCSYI